MDKDFQTEAAVVRQLAEDRLIVEVGDTKFSSLPMKPVFFQPRPAPLKVRSLTAVTGYLESKKDFSDLSAVLVHVRSHEAVEVVSILGGEDLGRDSYMLSEYDGTRFKFGEWMPPEQFIIGVNALFIPSTGRDTLLNFVSRLKVEDEGGIVDDGVSQTVSVRVGIKGGLTDTEKSPSRVVLVPFRTFREIDQPESEFLFRMRRNGDGVQLALFEADGGAWRQIAMDRIADWIEDAMKGEVTVIA